MKIIRCDQSHAARWNAFVHSCSTASFYHRWEWKAINEEALGHTAVYLAAVDGEEFVGVFPVVRVKSRLFGNVSCSMPFVNYGGPATELDLAEQELLTAASAVANEWNVEYLEIRSQRRLSESYPHSDHKISMTISLDRDADALMARFKRDQRAEIRRAQKNGFSTRFGSDLIGDFYEVLSDSWRDQGTPLYNIDYLRHILAAFPRETRVCVVYDADGRPAAGAFDGLHNGTVEGMWLGMRAEYRRQLVGYVLYWELIQHACQLGYDRFHLGRSSRDSGSEQFKKKWNADVMQLYWHYILRTRDTIPQLNVTNRKFQLAIAAWRKLPVSVTRVIGPPIARCIP